MKTRSSVEIWYCEIIRTYAEKANLIQWQNTVEYELRRIEDTAIGSLQLYILSVLREYHTLTISAEKDLFLRFLLLFHT